MRKYLFLVLLVTASFCAAAQPGVPQLSAFSQDSTKSVFETSSNGYRIAWSYYSYCTYNICFNNGVALQVYDSNGTRLTRLIWEKPYVSSSNTQSKISILDATVDRDDNLVIVGSFRCKVNFSPNDPAPTYYNGDSTFSNSGTMFLAKYRVTDGHFLWAKLMKKADTSMYSYPMFSFASLVTDNNKNIYLLGLKISGAVDINPGNTTPAVYDYPQQFLAKYNSAGDYQTSVAADAYSLSYYKTLRYINGNLYGIGAIDSGSRQTYLLKQYDLNTLAATRRKTFGYFNIDALASGRQQRVEMVIAKNDIWLLGSAVANASIPAAGNSVSLAGMPYGLHAFYLMRMDNNWNLTDARLLQKTTSQYNCPVALGVDSLSNLLIAGCVADSINADLAGGSVWIRNSTSYRSNTYLCYYNGSLALQWAKQIGDTSYVGLTSAVFGSNRNIYFTGSLSGKANFSFTGGSGVYTGPATGTYNNYYARYKWATAGLTPTRVSYPHTPAAFSIYPNPAITALYVHTGSATTGDEALLSVYSLDGKLVKAQLMKGAATLGLDVSSLMPGAYFLKIEASPGNIEFHRFVKVD